MRPFRFTSSSPGSAGPLAVAPPLTCVGRRSIWGAALLLGLAAPALAQDLDCTNPVTQVEMTGCASRAAEAADKQLNETWQRAIAAARERDEADPGYEPSSQEILRDAQRSWITFRDQACSAEATIARGGTMASQLFLMCLERLTQRRTEDLHLFTETN